MSIENNTSSLEEVLQMVNSLPSGVDLSQDTVSPSTLLNGITAHDSTSQAITGAIPIYTNPTIVVYESFPQLLSSGFYNSIRVEARYKIDEEYTIYPLNGAELGNLPILVCNVVKNQTVKITTYLTQDKGYTYDARQCGGEYSLGSHSTTEGAQQIITIAKDGKLIFSGFNGTDMNRPGQIAANTSDALYGYWYNVKITNPIPEPTGTLQITEPGIYNVSTYAFVQVN